jgi:serine/threonine protein kinase
VRPVAIKVPHPQQVARPADVEAYLAEARTLASLDHPHIVPVHDVGRSDDGLCYVVSKYIPGSDLAKKLKEARPSFAEAAGLVAAVADALHHAHTRGLVHRDVKPGNLLLDTAGKAYLGDFGLALREEDFGKGAGFAGTPVYMSPEQASREGHRVDGRSDIFSLGGVLYELLTGRLPFRGDTREELLEQIIAVEPRPPRQIDDAVPKELERICLKALAKRACERYTTAKDMAEDLQAFLAARQQHRVSLDVKMGRIGCVVAISLALLMVVSLPLMLYRRAEPLDAKVSFPDIAKHPDARVNSPDAEAAMVASVVGHMTPSGGLGPLAAATVVIATDATKDTPR